MDSQNLCHKERPDPSTGDTETGISDAHWPASVADSVNSRFSERPLLSQKVEGHGYTFKSDAEIDWGVYV